MVLYLTRLVSILFFLFNDDLFTPLILLIVGNFDSFSQHQPHLSLLLLSFLMDDSQSLQFLLLCDSLLLGQVCLTFDLSLDLYSFDHFSSEVSQLYL